MPSATPAQARLEQQPPARLSAAGMPPQAATATDAPASRTTGQSQTALPSVDEMIQRVQAKLQRNPGDSEGWRMLGWAYFSVERFSDAANAYSRAIELRPIPRNTTAPAARRWSGRLTGPSRPKPGRTSTRR